MFKVKTGVKKQIVEAVIIRKDGTRENLGTIAQFENKSLIRRLLKWLTL